MHRAFVFLLVALLAGVGCLAAPIPGSNTIATKETTSNNTVEVAFKETCYTELYADTSKFQVQFSKEVLLQDPDGHNLFVMDGYKKTEDDVEYYFREFCYKDLNVKTHDANTAQAAIHGVNNGAVTQPFNDHSATTVDTVNGQKVDKGDGKRKRAVPDVLGIANSAVDASPATDDTDTTTGTSTGAFGGAGALTPTTPLLGAGGLGTTALRVGGVGGGADDADDGAEHLSSHTGGTATAHRGNGEGDDD